MRLDGFWRVFAETGEPMAYLLYRSSEDRPCRNDQDKKPERAREDPRPSD